MRTSLPTGQVADAAFLGLLASVGVAAVATVVCLVGARHLLQPCFFILCTTIAALWAFCLLLPSPERER
jgi:hypothetical protein